MKFMDLIKEIIKRKQNCIIISPHQDDAVLSCGELLSQLAGKVDITIINIFTAAHKNPYTLSAKQFLKASGYQDAEALYKEREKEDRKVLSTLPVSITNLGLEDALFRRKKYTNFLSRFLSELSHSYPTYRWHILKGITKDDYAVDELKNKLKRFKKKNTLIFAPFGIGNHVDHIIARKVCEQLFDNLILYSDFPYNIRLHTYGKATKNQQVYKLHPSIDKNKMIQLYRTQFKGLFPDGKIPTHKEVYFFNKNLWKK